MWESYSYLLAVINMLYNVYLFRQGTVLERLSRMLRIMRKFSVNALKSSSLCNEVNFFPNFETSSVSKRNIQVTLTKHFKLGFFFVFPLEISIQTECVISH